MLEPPLRSARASQSRAVDGRRELPLSSELTEAGQSVLRDDLERRWLSFATSAWLTLLLTFTDTPVFHNNCNYSDGIIFPSS